MDKWMGSGSSSMDLTRRGTCMDGGGSMLSRAPSAARRGSSFALAAFNFQRGGNSCGKCKGKGAVECPGCKGSGKNKKNGNLFERWKCFDCQGFGLVSCPSCGKGGLTPEQRGER